MRIGVISDTHDFFDPAVPKLLAGVDHILHAGDVGLPWILLELEQIAPVTAVRGNTDSESTLRETEVVELGKRKFLVHHIVDPALPGASVRARLIRENPDVVVFGHTHERCCETRDGVLFFNPGYAGRPRGSTARSVAILHCDAAGITAEYLPL
jgi:hypothetical protein